MVMSQDTIDSLMAQAKSGDGGDQPAGDNPVPEEDDPETAAVLEELDAEVADVDPEAVAALTPPRARSRSSS